MTISPAQCRAARALIGMSQTDLAHRAVVTPNVIVDFENGTRMPFAITLAAIRAALEGEGVIFLDDDGDGEGVRKRKRKR
jgi:transcriptional regulator with XRE-family HTH domain